jgi:hypothetical protein
MKNIEMMVEENVLIIKVDLNKEFGPSASGKNIIIASTEGNVAIPGREDAKVGLNVYRLEENPLEPDIKKLRRKIEDRLRKNNDPKELMHLAKLLKIEIPYLPFDETWT